MPEVPARPRTGAQKARIKGLALWDLFINSAALATVLVALVACLLWLLRVELQYVVGGFLIVFASRLSHKRVAPNVTVEAPSRKTPTRDLLDPRDKVNLNP